MFSGITSGLTSQVSNWMGKKGEDGQDLPGEGGGAAGPGAAASDQTSAELADLEKKDASPTKGNSKLEMLAGVKSQMSGWLSGVPSIPGLNRGNPGEPEAGQQPGETGEATQPTSGDTLAKASEHVKDDDASSATGGADSGPASLEGTPTDDKEGQFGAVSTKALAGAKSFGGFLYSAVNKAGKSVVEASVKIKKTVEENRLISDLNKEQEAFIAGKSGFKGEPVPPWVGSPNEEALKEECLALSTDRRNFVRAPPPGVDFPWDFEAVQPMAEATLAVDPNLESMRFELVPKVISEENFWRNYFYRVSLLRQSHELNAMANQSGDSNPNQSFVSNDSIDQPQVTLDSNGVKPSVLSSNSETPSKVSKDINEINKGTQALKLKSTSNKEEDWERELENELKDYEVVPGQDKNSSGKDDWDEGQIDELLNYVEDLK